MSVHALNQVINFPTHKNQMDIEKKGPAILISCNNLEYSATLEKIFGDDFHLLFSATGREALEIAVKEDINLIFLDASIPDISELLACTKLKRNPLTADVGVIITYSQTSDYDHEKALIAGAINCFPHDFAQEALQTRVFEHITLLEEKKKLEIRCCVDGLTGLTNKTQFYTVLNQEWHSAIRGDYSIAVIMLDIDNFKLFNDSFGHLEGDKCLVSVADAIATSTERDEDIAARFGGEEFVLLLPFTDLKGACKVASRILENVRSLKISHNEESDLPIVTVSAGIAAYSPSHMDSDTFTAQDLVDEADTNLYKAKSEGRNCWV